MDKKNQRYVKISFKLLYIKVAIKLPKSSHNSMYVFLCYILQNDRNNLNHKKYGSLHSRTDGLTD